MFDYTQFDNQGLHMSPKQVREALNPVYTGAEVLRTTRPAWHENKTLYRHFVLKRMQPGKLVCIEGLEVYRRPSLIVKYWIEGQEFNLDAAVAYIGAAVADVDRPKRPYFVLQPIQKKIIRYWMKSEDENGYPPFVTVAAKELRRSFQMISDEIKTLKLYGVMYSDSGRDGQCREMWHTNRERIQYVSLEEK